MPSVPEATTNNDQQPFPSTSHLQYPLHLHATSCPKRRISKMSPIKTLRAQSVSSIAGPTAIQSIPAFLNSLTYEKTLYNLTTTGIIS